MGERKAGLQEHMVVEEHRPLGVRKLAGVVGRFVELVGTRLVGMRAVVLDMALFKDSAIFLSLLIFFITDFQSLIF